MSQRSLALVLLLVSVLLVVVSTYVLLGGVR